MSETMKVGVIGVGSMGANHVRVYANRDDALLMGIVEPNGELGARVAARFKTEDFKSVEEFLEVHAPDIVSIAVPTKFHVEMAETCLRAGVNCLLEKPIATSVKDAEYLADLSRKLGKKLLIGHIERYNPAVQALNEHVHAGELGEIYRIEVERSGPFPARIADTGVCLDLAVHDLDIVSMLLDSMPNEINSVTQQLLHKQHEDAVFATLEYPNGVVGLLNVNWTSPVKRRILKIFGSKGMFQVNYVTQELRFFENADQIDAEQPWENPGIREGREIRFAVGYKEPLANEIDYMFRVVRNDLNVDDALQDSINALDLAETIRRGTKTA